MIKPNKPVRYVFILFPKEKVIIGFKKESFVGTIVNILHLIVVEKYFLFQTAK